MVTTVHMWLSLESLTFRESTVMKKNSCGMNWEAEVSLHPSTLEIVLWCSPDFEGSVWFCEAHIAISLSASRGYAEQGRNEPIREALVTFHPRNPSHLFVIPRSEITSNLQTIEITFGIRSVVSYSGRQPRLTTKQFSTSSTSLNSRVAPSDSPRHVASPERNPVTEGGISLVERETPPELDRRQSQEAPSDPTTDKTTDQSDLSKTATPSNVEGSSPHTNSKSSFGDDNTDVGLEVLFALEERIAQLEKTSTAAVVYSNLEAVLLGDLRARIKQLELDSTATVENSYMESATLRNLEARIARIENGTNAKAKSSKFRRLWRASAGRLIKAKHLAAPPTNGTAVALKKPSITRDDPEEPAFKKFHPNKLETCKIIVVGPDMEKFSMHDIFHDISLEPYMPLECVTKTFVKHFHTKLSEDEIVSLPNSQSSGVFPILIEQIASAIITGFNLEDQLRDDGFLIKELRLILERQLYKDFGK
uniref:KIX_2 domain-containing protein n=1 Tax=Haemonchus contortus TaxID=6289 RepID=A0A7I4XX35_HAECO